MTKTKQETTAMAETPVAIPHAAVQAQLTNNWRGISDADKVKYALAICKSLDIPTPLNPFKFIDLSKAKNGSKVVLYATKEAAELLAERNKLSVNISNKYFDRDANLYVVEVRVSTRDGRTIDNLAAISMAGASGEERCNRMMKCVSKAVRRGVFSAVGLSVVDDDEKQYIEHGPSMYATPPAIPPSHIAPVPEGGVQLSPEAQEIATEAVAARAELITTLCGKDGMFGPKRIKDAKEWIAEVASKPYEMLTPDDCQEVLGHHDAILASPPEESMREPGEDEDEDNATEGCSNENN